MVITSFSVETAPRGYASTFNIVLRNDYPLNTVFSITVSSAFVLKILSHVMFEKSTYFRKDLSHSGSTYIVQDEAKVKKDNAQHQLRHIYSVESIGGHQLTVWRIDTTLPQPAKRLTKNAR